MGTDFQSKVDFDEAPGPVRKIFWFVLGISILIRLWGTWYGLPFSYWVDEYHEVLRALELGAGGFNFERTTKGGLYFLLFVEYGLYFVCLKIAGLVTSTREFAELFVRDPSAFYLMGRVTAALIGSATVAATFVLARRAYSATAGLLAMLFLAVNVLHIELSRRIGVDVPMTLLATLALYFALRIAADGHRRDYLLAALCAALSTTTKLPGILLVVPLLIAHTIFVSKVRSGIRGWFGSRDLWLAAAALIVVLVATNPGIVQETGYLSLFLDAPGELADSESNEAFEEFSGGDRPNLYMYYLAALQSSMGWPLFAICLMSVAYALWRHKPSDVMLLSYAAIHYLVISSTTSDMLYYPRYAVPIIVVLAVLSGRALADFGHKFKPRHVAAMLGIAAGLVVVPVGQSIVTAQALAQTDTRTLAKNWIEAHVPMGSRVLIEGLKIGPVKGTVQLRETRRAIERRIEHWRIVEPKQARFLELQLAVYEGGGYELVLAQRESVATLEEYQASGVEYFVIRPGPFMASRRVDIGGAHLVRELRAHTGVRMIKRFEGDSPTQLGPTIEIYGPRN